MPIPPEEFDARSAVVAYRFADPTRLNVVASPMTGRLAQDEAKSLVVLGAEALYTAPGATEKQSANRVSTTGPV